MFPIAQIFFDSLHIHGIVELYQRNVFHHSTRVYDKENTISVRQHDMASKGVQSSKDTMTMQKT